MSVLPVSLEFLHYPIEAVIVTIQIRVVDLIRAAGNETLDAVNLPCQKRPGLKPGGERRQKNTM